MSEKLETYAKKILELAGDVIIVNMRFMDVAVARMRPFSREHLGCAASDGEWYYYDPKYLLGRYLEDENIPVRMYMHSILHFVFNHSFGYGRLQERLWDVSCDIAVENLVLELEVSGFSLPDDDERKVRLKALKKYVPVMTAERIYKYFLANPPSDHGMSEYLRLFTMDSHVFWKERETIELSEEEWKKLSERIKADIRSFSNSNSHSESLIENLEEATREKYDYRRILERFCMRGEELKVSDEEFDYIYYTYGLSHYDNMPLIEPLEFKEEKKVRDFAIILDTSASCRGDIIRGFLTTTYDILKNSESFSENVNVHIIQCDSQVQSDTVIKNRGDFEEFIKTGKIYGYGGTDFRPAFDYVESLVEEGDLKNFKGLIYFTDGYGIYPEKKPGYDCIFAFVSRDDMRPSVPWWATEVLFEEVQLENT